MPVEYFTYKGRKVKAIIPSFDPKSVPRIRTRTEYKGCIQKEKN